MSAVHVDLARERGHQHTPAARGAEIRCQHECRVCGAAPLVPRVRCWSRSSTRFEAFEDAPTTRRDIYACGPTILSATRSPPRWARVCDVQQRINNDIISDANCIVIVA